MATLSLTYHDFYSVIWQEYDGDNDFVDYQTGSIPECTSRMTRELIEKKGGSVDHLDPLILETIVFMVVRQARITELDYEAIHDAKTDKKARELERISMDRSTQWGVMMEHMVNYLDHQRFVVPE